MSGDVVLIGIGVPISGSWATPANQLRLVRRAEELGYHSAWTFQRLLVPERPGERAGIEAYRSVHDAIVPLAFVAGHTTRIRLGVSVLNIPFFSPALMAKQLATLDAVCGGRLDVGLGIGWMREEYGAAGAPRSSWPPCARCGPRRSSSSTASSTRSRARVWSPSRCSARTRR